MENQLFYPHLEWNSAKKFLLRFALIFFPLLSLPILTVFGADLYPWIAKTIFGINEISLEQTGSGDMYYSYMELFVCVSLATVISIVWSFFNNKNKNYDTVLHYFLVFLRYYLAFWMMSYGYAKVFYNQFGNPTLWKLVQPYGESSPMGIAWTFIGASKPYTVFSGLAELLGGILLFSRRTALIGALVSFAVMFNVMMMNYCYDVPVKLFSTQLVIVAFIIIICNSHYFWNAIWSNRASEAIIYKPLFTKKWLKITRIVVKSIIVFALIVLDGYEQSGSIEYAGPNAPKTALYGIHKPIQFIKNGDTLRTYSDSAEWKYLVIEWEGLASIRQLNDRSYRLDFKVDTIKKNITANLQSDTLHKYQLSYKQLNDTTLNLKGVFVKDTIDYTFGKVNMKSFRLINRGFHWVNEYPFNK